ncbi:PAS domain S-box/diguanylate cyclase (GGDEF) domain-containing protein [Pseudomonas sp. GM74]|uniref:GGDEF domain-containing protein n=1 Tax=Pseudomonas sp. GM74 TaxID=1144336 RepID=UPI0002706AF5|nr:sensor domain-containing diguanylate cyclase [Pseudomonas sp. GM74]EJM97417.1 PAS domain S-box/diguanylate cyclase (GGDEF) domain-containing protein [Pseudomonas sp. GM74]
MAQKNLQDSSPSHRPEAAQTLIALIHAQCEVARLSEREQLLNTLLMSVNAVLWAFDWETRRVLYVSPAYERIFGRSVERLLADCNQWRGSIYPEDLDYAERSLAEVLDKGAVEDREYRIIAADGQVRWLSDKCYVNRQAEPGQPVIIVGIAEDITDKKRMESELHRLATTDALTQSSNRRHFFECAHREFTRARQKGEPLSFLMLDIDDFKIINDTYGHQKGDNVLQRIADSGRAALRRGDLFGRIGGEEFAAVFPGCTPKMALQVAERLQQQIQRLRFTHEGQTFGITVSQGLTSLTAADGNVENLFSRADAAMYQAKREGKNRIVTA